MKLDRGAAGRVRHLVVVGGGRWSRVIAEVALDSLPPDTKITLVCRSTSEVMRRWLASGSIAPRVDRRAGPVVIERDIPALRRPVAAAAIVANGSVDHAHTAATLLRAGYNVLVEKPLALRLTDATDLIKLARARDRLLAASLVYAFAPFIRHLPMIQPIRSSPLQELSLIWHDPAIEARHGESKRFEAGIGIIEDLLPHVWSIVTRVTAGRRVRVRSLKALSGGAGVVGELECGNVRGSIDLARLGSARRRVLTVRSKARVVELDFSAEPGTLKVDGRSRAWPDSWTAGPSPLARQVAWFARQPQRYRSDHSLTGRNVLQPVALLQRAQRDVLAQQVDAIAVDAFDPQVCAAEGAIYALQEILARQARRAIDSEVFRDRARLRTLAVATRTALARCADARRSCGMLVDPAEYEFVRALGESESLRDVHARLCQHALP